MGKIGLVFALAISGASCGVGVGEDLAALGEDEDGLEVEELAGGKADAYSDIVGTWQSQVADAGGFGLVALLRNKKYHTEKTVYCVRAPCPPISEAGIYRLTRSGSKRYLTFSPVLHNARPVKYEYKLAGDSLKLRKVNTRSWQTLTRNGQLWCGTPSDCSQQPFVHIMCVGTTTCIQNRCGYDCSAPRDCRQTGCSTGRYCTYCWTGYACIPNGAMC
ncbi:MAG: hypothetical protein HYY84_07040 [Deltaproteobacteria bacterium]|nr:hypothetical protein [Deltaproteobacteria bacterium]